MMCSKKFIIESQSKSQELEMKVKNVKLRPTPPPSREPSSADVTAG